MSKGSTSAEFWYGPDRARVLQLATRSTESERTVYLGSLYERTVITPNTGSATTRHVHYVRAGDETVAIKTWSKVGTGAYTPQVRYPHRDHLGSVVAITTETGTVESRSSFDVWGKRRDPATWVTPAPGTFTAAPTATDRGYTGHEHVDELGLVHMNGRIYDPEIGKFLSADPTLQFPESTQGYNRYAYAGNNPLTFTDPSGFSLRMLLRVIAIAVISYFTAGAATTWLSASAGWGATAAAMGGAFVGGFVGGFLGSGGNLRVALFSGFGAALTAEIGSKFGKLTPSDGMKFLAKAVAHGVSQGAINATLGGTFKDGFMGGLAGSVFEPIADFVGNNANSEWVATVAASIVGGTVAVLGGGKFANGAASAAFVDMFNRRGHREVQNRSTKKPYSAKDAIEYLEANALIASDGQCATFTRRAIAAGGIDLERTSRARDYGQSLLRAGFTQVDTVDYVPVQGDVAFIQPPPGQNNGHMQMYSGKSWISDFVQRTFYPGPNYRRTTPSYEIYRPPYEAAP